MPETPLRRLLNLLPLVLLLLLSGCVYLRLFKTKQQLSSFDQYFELSDQRGLTLIFKEPVLLEKDIVWLMRHHPNSNRITPEGTEWKYLYAKQYRDEDLKGEEKGRYDIPITMVFKAEKLKQLILPKRFLKAVTLPLLRKMLQSVGEAEVTKSERRARSEFKVGAQYEIPTEKQIHLVLGKPYSIEESPDEDLLHYRYTRSGNSSGKGPTVIKMKFRVTKEERQVKSGSVYIRGLELSIDFHT